jgi:hypothetical protein
VRRGLGHNVYWFLKDHEQVKIAVRSPTSAPLRSTRAFINEHLFKMNAGVITRRLVSPCSVLRASTSSRLQFVSPGRFAGSASATTADGHVVLYESLRHTLRAHRLLLWAPRLNSPRPHR